MVLAGPIPGNFRTTSGLLGDVAFPHVCDVANPRPQLPDRARHGIYLPFCRCQFSSQTAMVLFCRRFRMTRNFSPSAATS